MLLTSNFAFIERKNVTKKKACQESFALLFLPTYEFRET